MAPSPARPAEQRKKDTLHRLEKIDEDVWVATADAGGGVPFLVPLSFLWDGSASPSCTSVSCRPGDRPGARPTSWRGGC